MAKTASKIVVPNTQTPDTQPGVIAPTPSIETDPNFSLPGVVATRPHSMPRRLINTPASRADTSGKE